MFFFVRVSNNEFEKKKFFCAIKKELSQSFLDKLSKVREELKERKIMTVSTMEPGDLLLMQMKENWSDIV